VCATRCCSIALQSKTANIHHWLIPDRQYLVCCSVFQRVAVCCSVLQCFTLRYSVLQCVVACFNVLQRGVVCFNALQCVEVCCSDVAHFSTETPAHSVCCRVLQCIAVRCSAMQCDSVRCSVLHCVMVTSHKCMQGLERVEYIARRRGIHTTSRTTSRRISCGTRRSGCRRGG